MLEGSKIVLGSYSAAINDRHLQSFEISPDGEVKLALAPPTVDAAMNEYFNVAETGENYGEVDLYGDISVVIPIEVSGEEHDSPTLVHVKMTTGEAVCTTVSGEACSTPITLMGTPLRPDGTMTLVGVAEFETGPFGKDVERIVLNVRAN